MILDKLENAALYSSITENLKKGFNFLQNTDLKYLTPGKYPIKGDDVFAMVSEYETKNHQDCRPEAHRLYADIQYIISGKEAIGFVTLNNQKVTDEYNLEKDIEFLSCETVQLIVESGMFAVFFPQDIHRPCMLIDGPEKVKKVVIKVLI